MAELGAPKATLEAHGLRHKRHFGQNFLTDRRIAARIVELCTTPLGGTAVEIGAGLGALTAGLVERATTVIAIERDRDLVPLLEEAFARDVANARLRVLEADAKKADYRALFADRPHPRVLAGNLPYQLTGPLVEIAVGLADAVDRAVFMVQLEVAERLAASAGGEAYGALTVFVQAAFEVERAFVVKRGAFYPQPNVDSAVVVLTPRRPPITEETDAFRRLVHAAFAQRRKTLRNAWKTALDLGPEELSHAAKAAGIDLDDRGETLDVRAFAKMARIVEKARR